MQTKISKWGNSQGIRIPSNILSAANLRVGNPIEIISKNGNIIVRSCRRDPRGRHDLKTLMSGFPADYSPHEIDYVPVGKEI